MLENLLSRYFTRSVRDKGAEYARHGAVQSLLTDPQTSYVWAEVEGTDMYSVAIEIEPKAKTWNVFVACTCPYMDTYNAPCKHVYATLLSVNWREEFGPLPEKATLGVGKYIDENDDLYDDEEEDSGDFDDDLDGFVEYDEYPAGDFSERSGVGGVGGQHLRLASSEAPATPIQQIPSAPEWSLFLDRIHRNLGLRNHTAGRREIGDIQYIINQDYPSFGRHDFNVMLMHRPRTPTGKLGKMRHLRMCREDLPFIENPLDRQICTMLLGLDTGYAQYWSRTSSGTSGPWSLSGGIASDLLPLLARTGRLHHGLTRRGAEPEPLSVDLDDPWSFVASLSRNGKKGQYMLDGCLKRRDEVRELDPESIMSLGEPTFVFHDGRIEAVDAHGCTDWLVRLAESGPIPVPSDALEPFMNRMADLRRIPRIEWPADYGVTEVTDVPKPELELQNDHALNGSRSYALARLRFRYGDASVDADTEGSVFLDPENKRQIVRQHEKEKEFLKRMFELGVQEHRYDGLRLPAKRIPDLVLPLVHEGWTVTGGAVRYRKADDFSLKVSTGIDWFELEGGADFAGMHVPLPELLKAVRAGKTFVELSDGSMGILPEEWLQRFGAGIRLGSVKQGKVRFAKTQLSLIDALLAEMPEASFDKKLEEARGRLRNFDGIKPLSPPSNFQGKLRDYQRDALGWFDFLHQFNWGGCLADDMGLGKTVEALALLAGRRRANRKKPSLAIVPKSLVFNWIREAERFCPDLKVLDYTGTERKALRRQFAKADLIVSTYGTFKRDIEFLRKKRFNYLILDEAQAIKNPSSQNAKAALLLQADHRLVMTGTPVENRLDDLWSLFEFLNPGMLGTVKAFQNAFAGKSAANGDGQASANGSNGHLEFLQKALRPFILRRTKEQVAPELPDRFEQIVECTMPAKQAQYYDELRDHYRASLLQRVERDGMARSKVYVLEALLRLRQAACHPGLIDESKREVDAAKLENLLPMLAELTEEGHKALVFSQFTSMLSIIREHLDAQGLPYEYLDGKTRKRDRCVDRFQNDPKCPLFLISLKAGGTGLNLTAADYVFILDPWWNPAVEAQAIDRTHRIGQDKKVIAYRLITRDTVEAKILELQKSKRELASAIVTEANSMIRDLSREDLESLLA